jgi:hypothetical protein
MSKSSRLVQLAPLAEGAAIVALAVSQRRAKHQTLEVTAPPVHGELDEIDPATGGVVIARLEMDAAKDVQARLART